MLILISLRILTMRQFMSGNMTAYYLHGKAIVTMVTQRGGSLGLGPEGFLGDLLVWSVLDPKRHIVFGPYLEPLDESEQGQDIWFEV